MESYNVWCFVTGFFQLGQCPQGSSMLQYVTQFPSFLRLNRIPSCRLATFCLSLHQLMGMRVVSTFWLLWITLLQTFERRFLWGRVFSCLGHILRTLIAGHMLLLRFVIWELPHWSPKQLLCHPHQQRMRAPVSPHPRQHLFHDILTLALLVVVKWYLVVVKIPGFFNNKSKLGLMGNVSC